MPITLDDTLKIITLSTVPASPPAAGYTYLYNLADGLYQMYSDGSINKVYNDEKTLTVPNNINTNVVARADIPQFTFSIIAGKKYSIEINGFIRSSVGTRGVSMGFILPTGVATIFGSLEIANSQTYTSLLGTVINQLSSSSTLPGSFLLSTNVNPTNADHVIKAKLILNCVTSGNFQVQFGAENTNATATLVGGATLTYKLLN